MVCAPCGLSWGRPATPAPCPSLWSSWPGAALSTPCSRLGCTSLASLVSPPDCALPPPQPLSCAGSICPRSSSVPCPAPCLVSVAGVTLVPPSSPYGPPSHGAEAVELGVSMSLLGDIPVGPAPGRHPTLHLGPLSRQLGSGALCVLAPASRRHRPREERDLTPGLCGGEGGDGSQVSPLRTRESWDSGLPGGLGDPAQTPTSSLTWEVSPVHLL